MSSAAAHYAASVPMSAQILRALPTLRCCAGWLAACGASLAIGACGASHSHGASHNAIKSSSAQTTATATAPAGTPARNGVCHSVRAPSPRGPQHIAKPTLKLDPSKRYVAHLVTNCGDIEIQLDVKRAPKIAASFAYLANMGFYDELTFHRVVTGFVIQGGDPNGDGSGGPGYIVVERPPANLRYTKGTVAMAKSESDPPGAAGSQFFIVTGKNVELPPQYALLGRVIGGEKTIAAISHVPTTAGTDGEDSAPATPIVIREATVSGS